MSHPVPFMKASGVVAPAKASREKPDLEEAIEDEDEAEGPAPDSEPDTADPDSADAGDHSDAESD